jgi:hypothetical protein
MRRVVSAREQAELLSPWRKVADDLLKSPPTAPATLSPAMPSTPPPAPPAPAAPPTMTSIPRSEFDNVLASKGVTYDQHLDNLESHFNGATEDQQRRGRVWYRAGGDTLRDIGKKFGISTHRAIAMAAALSSRTDWNNNLHYAAHMAGNYRPGENEDEWRRANIHPLAMSKYMESKYDITPQNGDTFTHSELRKLKAGGYMPRTKADFNQLAEAHGGDHWQYMEREGQPGTWTHGPLKGFESLQTPEGRAAWINNAQLPSRGGIESDRARYEDAIDGHYRAVKSTKSKNGYAPTSAFTGAGVPTLGSNVEKAKLLMRADENDFDKHLNGQKYKAFFSNLGNKLGFRKAARPEEQGYYDLGGKHWTELDPELLRSTVDTQHMRAASMPHGSDAPAPNYTESSQVTPEQYEVYQQGLIDLTHRINSKRHPSQHLLPHQVQAVIWGKFKDDMNARSAKKPAGQTFWSPSMDDIEPFADRYSMNKTAAHVHPKLLEPPLSDPFETDSDEWFGHVMDSWEQNHQHELSGTPVPPDHDELAASRDVLAFVDRVLAFGPKAEQPRCTCPGRMTWNPQCPVHGIDPVTH